MGDDSQLDYDELKNEAQSVRDDQDINDEMINPVRAEYEELKFNIRNDELEKFEEYNVSLKNRLKKLEEAYKQHLQ